MAPTPLRRDYVGRISAPGERPGFLVVLPEENFSVARMERKAATCLSERQVTDISLVDRPLQTSPEVRKTVISLRNQQTRKERTGNGIQQIREDRPHGRGAQALGAHQEAAEDAAEECAQGGDHLGSGRGPRDPRDVPPDGQRQEDHMALVGAISRGAGRWLAV